VLIDDFIEKFAFAIEVEADSLTPDTRFKDLPVWDSLNTLAIIAMADADYGITLTGRDIEDANTVDDLWVVASAKSTAAK
jgi:acyl carrier protein